MRRPTTHTIACARTARRREDDGRASLTLWWLGYPRQDLCPRLSRENRGVDSMGTTRPEITDIVARDCAQLRALGIRVDQAMRCKSLNGGTMGSSIVCRSSCAACPDLRRPLAFQVDLDAIRCPGGDTTAKKVRVFRPDGAVKQQGQCKTRPVVFIPTL